MAHIIQIGNRWRAQVRARSAEGRKSTAKTFDSKVEAERWARRIETELDDQKVKQALGVKLGGTSANLGELIRAYRRIRDELGRPIDPASNTYYMLQHLEDDLGSEMVSDLTPARIVKWAKMRKAEGAGGYTVNMELSQLGTVLRHCSSFMQLQLPDVVGAARPLLNYGQLITGGGRRTRRPTQEELAALLAHLDAKDTVVADAVRVAAITGLRRGELARIQWSDLDPDRKAVLVRQRKHPRKIEAKDEWVPLLGEAWDIVARQPLVDERIFPASPEKLTDNVTAATRALGIPDLRLHDMRREATSRLRELGFDSDARKAITGHKSDEIHSRYVKVNLEDLHQQYADAQGSAPRPARPRTGRARPT
jgi:integrase